MLVAPPDASTLVSPADTVHCPPPVRCCCAAICCGSITDATRLMHRKYHAEIKGHTRQQMPSRPLATEPYDAICHPLVATWMHLAHHNCQCHTMLLQDANAPILSEIYDFMLCAGVQIHMPTQLIHLTITPSMKAPVSTLLYML